MITIDYVLSKAITWLRRMKKTNSINSICPCLEPQHNYSKTKFNNFMLLYFNFRRQYAFRLPVSPYTTKFVFIFRKKTISEIVSLETVWITRLIFLSRPISSIKTLRKLAHNLSYFETQKCGRYNARKYCFCEAFLHDLFVLFLFCGLRKRKYLTYTRLASPWICALGAKCFFCIQFTVLYKFPIATYFVILTHFKPSCLFECLAK